MLISTLTAGVGSGVQRRYSWLMLLRSLLLTFVFACGLFAQENPDWTTPHVPYRVIGNVYYVGSKDLASYLITTPQGHILINSSLQRTVPLIRKSVESLGFK